MSRWRTLFNSEAVLILGLVAFAGAAYLLERISGLQGPVRLSPMLALALSVVPALLWLGYFYQQDRHEPEPKHYVFGTYLLGAFIAAPLAGFLVHSIPGAGAVMGFSPFSPDRLVSAFLVIALSQETAKYVVVRYTVYPSQEFDEPIDGIIYMMAAGIGFATADNYRYLQGLQGTIFLGSGVANTVITTLAHACFAGVLGYAMGKAKFLTGDGKGSRRRSLTLMAGLIAATLLNGIFTTIEGAVKISGLSVEPWRGLAWAALFAVMVFFATSVLMRRHLGKRVAGAKA